MGCYLDQIYSISPAFICSQEHEDHRVLSDFLFVVILTVLSESMLFNYAYLKVGSLVRDFVVVAPMPVALSWRVWLKWKCLQETAPWENCFSVSSQRVSLCKRVHWWHFRVMMSSKFLKYPRLTCGEIYHYGVCLKVNTVHSNSTDWK